MWMATDTPGPQILVGGKIANQMQDQLALGLTPTEIGPTSGILVDLPLILAPTITSE